ncbi:hypothetical protein M0Q97_02550 [Candidatus Dojkabacteria bacterium]|jgi:hypothetical protein|nr:hypothetical protein [Candidatus Dojkabacteria bacterium]
MKRNILFKAKTFDNEWIESMTIRKSIYSDYRINDDLYLFVDEKWIKCLPETLCEFTGKIIPLEHPMFYDYLQLFENDIFSVGEYKTKYVVKMENYQWIGISNEGDDYGSYKYHLNTKEKITLHGNAIDNPELIFTK